MIRRGNRRRAIPFILAMAVMILAIVPVIIAGEAEPGEAPGRTMAKQATKSMGHWNTTDHSKHDVLQQVIRG